MRAWRNTIKIECKSCMLITKSRLKVLSNKLKSSCITMVILQLFRNFNQQNYCSELANLKTKSR